MTVFSDTSEALDAHRNSQYGQQAAIATRDAFSEDATKLRNGLSRCVQQVLVNMAPARGPEGKPFGAANPSSNYGSNQDYRTNFTIFGQERLQEFPAAALSDYQRRDAIKA